MANYLCTLRGLIFPNSLGEIFSHSIAIQSSRTTADLAERIKSSWAAIWVAGTNMTPKWSSEVSYTEATAAPILNLTTGTLGAAHHAAFTPALAGAATGGTQLPSQVAHAISLTAGLRPNGAPIKGRFYLPPPVAPATMGNGTVTTQVRDGLATVFKTWLDDLMSTGDWPCVWSRSLGQMSVVQQVRVGNKLDTMRSRRNATPESYMTLSLVGPQ